MRDCARAVTLAAVLAAGTAMAAHAQLAVSANDAKVKLVDGKVEAQASPPADTVAFIDMRASPPRIVAELEVPNGAAGPPQNVAVSPKEDIALVASGTVNDVTDPTRQLPDDRVSVLDLAPLKPSLVGRFKKAVGLSKDARPPVPKVLTTVQAGKGAAGIAINKAGTLALVANRGEGTVSVFTIAGTTVTPAGKVTVGGDKSGPSAVVFSPDGKRALVSRDADNRIVVLSIDGTKVEATKREIAAGVRPYAMDISAKGEVAVVANAGSGGGDADTISVIDLRLDPPRVVGTYSVGQTPAGVKISPDGKYVAVTVLNGSDKPAGSPFYNTSGLLQVWARNGTQLSKSGEVAVGAWCQGVAWSSNGRTLLVQCMVEQEISVIRFSGLTGKSLQKVGSIKVKGSPAGIGTALAP